MDPSALLSIVTKAVVFGMNLLTLAGFVIMATGLNLNRTRKIRAPLAFVLMGVGTALVFAGIYTLHPTTG
jgi:hypothetical protein